MLVSHPPDLPTVAAPKDRAAFRRCCRSSKMLHRLPTCRSRRWRAARAPRAHDRYLGPCRRASAIASSSLATGRHSRIARGHDRASTRARFCLSIDRPHTVLRQERLAEPESRARRPQHALQVGRADHRRWCLPTSSSKNGHGAEFPLALAGRCIAALPARTGFPPHGTRSNAETLPRIPATRLRSRKAVA